MLWNGSDALEASFPSDGAVRTLGLSRWDCTQVTEAVQYGQALSSQSSGWTSPKGQAAAVASLEEDVGPVNLLLTL